MTESEINTRIAETRKHISDLIDEESHVDEDIKSRMREHIRQIIALSFGFSSLGKLFQFSANDELEKSVNGIMSEFKDSVYDITERRVLRSKTLSENRNKSNIEDAIILGFVFGKLGEYTFRERLNKYSIQIKMEIEAAIASGIFEGMSQTQILNQIMIYSNMPYVNPSIREAIKKGGFAATRIKSQGITYGTGRYTSGMANLKRIEFTAISQGYNYANHKIWGNNKNIIGYYAFRNSSYPCELCDSNVGFHKITDLTLPVHGNCQCGAFPVYKGEM